MSASILICTITAQIVRQYREKTARGVSPWLYMGQRTASSGLVVYSALTGSWVFVVLNAVMAVAAFAGLGLWVQMRRHDDAGAAATHA